MNIAILGYGSQGVSAYNYWKSLGHNVTICDNNLATKIPSGAESQLGEGYLSNLSRFDLLVRTPILHPSIIVKANSDDRTILNKVTTNTSEFIKVCPTKNIIGVTGTKGKGTTSTLIAEILKAAGKTVHLGGNIGIPPLDLLKNDIGQDDWVVLELANFQLIDLKASPHIGVCLMVEEEHLDWHEDLEEYLAAKQQMFINQTEDDIAIYYANNENSLSIADATMGKLIPYMEKPGATIESGYVTFNDKTICPVQDIKLLGKHNLQNVCAAITACMQVAEVTDVIPDVLKRFSGLEHRLEFVAEVDGVKYYDDSFGTTPSTAIVAIEAFQAPKVLILGGSDKKATYESLAKAVTVNNVKKVIAIGQTGPTISKKLNEQGYDAIVAGGSSMKEIVTLAKELAAPGDIILLSTACASFGMFKDYKDRGDQFKSIVSNL